MMGLIRSIAIISSFVCAVSVHAWYPYSEKYNTWQAERPYLVGALHNSVPTDMLAERVERMRAAGINTFIWSKPWNALHFYRAANDAGMEWAAWLIPGNTDILQEMLTIPGNSFIQVGDEPDTEEQMMEIGETADAVRRHTPGTPVFGNLSIAAVDHHRYVELVKPDVFSFDQYPLLRNGKTLDYYLYNLNWSRQTAMTYKLPYWMHLQAFGREHERPSYAYRIPDEADLRFLVFTFMAHGGTGIVWFHYYGHPESMVRDLGVENPARSEQPHIYANTIQYRSWYASRDVTPEIQNLAKAFLNLRPKDHVMYAGNPMLWKDAKPTYDNHNPEPPISNHAFSPQGALKKVEIAEEDEMGVLVSLFDDQRGEEYFMVVNMQHGTNMSKMDGMRTVVLSFDESVARIERLNRLTGKIEKLKTRDVQNGSRQLALQMEGGTGDLFKWSNGKPWALR